MIFWSREFFYADQTLPSQLAFQKIHTTSDGQPGWSYDPDYRNDIPYGVSTVSITWVACSCLRHAVLVWSPGLRTYVQTFLPQRTMGPVLICECLMIASCFFQSQSALLVHTHTQTLCTYIRTYVDAGKMQVKIPKRTFLLATKSRPTVCYQGSVSCTNHAVFW